MHRRAHARGRWSWCMDQENRRIPARSRLWRARAGQCMQYTLECQAQAHPARTLRRHQQVSKRITGGQGRVWTLLPPEHKQHPAGSEGQPSSRQAGITTHAGTYLACRCALCEIARLRLELVCLWPCVTKSAPNQDKTKKTSQSVSDARPIIVEQASSAKHAAYVVQRHGGRARRLRLESLGLQRLLRLERRHRLGWRQAREGIDQARGLRG